LYYTEPPKAPVVPVTNSTPPANITEPVANNTKTNTTAPPAPKRKYYNMTLSKLTLDNDTWVENNDKYGWRNHKISTSRMI